MESRNTFPERPKNLPDFKNPPVSEVVLGIQFPRIPGFTVADLGTVRQIFVNQYPGYQEMAPLEPAVELFEPTSQRRGMHIEMVEVPYPRLWFIDPTDTRLVQFQTDRLVHNWRKRGQNSDYPRFESVRDGFIGAYNLLVAHLDESGKGRLSPTLCEVTYVNTILSSENIDIRGRIGRIFKFWIDAFQSEIEDAAIVTREVLREEGSPYARLHVRITPIVDQNGEPAIKMTLMVRGIPKGSSINDIVSFFHHGREVIVRRFASLTTDEYHAVWGRNQ